MSIKEKAILVSLSVSIWTNAVKDDSVVADVMKKTRTQEDVHRYKKVLVKPEALAQVRAARVALRTYWWDNTLPWGNGGVRVLPSARFKDFANDLRGLRGEYERAVEAFVRAYPAMKKEARQRLGSLFDEDDFPSMDSIRRKFGMVVDYSPIPDADDFRVDLSEMERKELRKEVEKAVEESTRVAMTALVEKLRDTVSLLSARMKDDDPVLRATLITNIKEACREVGEFNLVDDKKIEEFKKAAEKLSTGVDLEKMKEDKKARKELATKADDVLARMAAYIGSAS